MTEVIFSLVLMSFVANWGAFFTKWSVLLERNNPLYQLLTFISLNRITQMTLKKYNIWRQSFTVATMLQQMSKSHNCHNSTDKLLRRCLESKNIIFTRGFALVIFSVAPLVKTMFFDSPSTALHSNNYCLIILQQLMFFKICNFFPEL
jgi:hypothetical protein